MRPLLLAFLLLPFFCTSCSPDRAQPAAKQQRARQPVAQLSPAERKARIDSLFDAQRSTLQVWVKVPGKAAPIRIYHEQWPEEVETTYNVLQDAAGNVVLFLEAPYSESGDWSISLIHYFDAQGRTFAFTRRTNFFNSFCTPGVAYENLTEYYDKDFRKTGTRYTLEDEKGNPLDRKKCDATYEEPYKVLPNREACLALLKKTTLR